MSRDPGSFEVLRSDYRYKGGLKCPACGKHSVAMAHGVSESCGSVSWVAWGNELEVTRAPAPSVHSEELLALSKVLQRVEARLEAELDRQRAGVVAEGDDVFTTPSECVELGYDCAAVVMKDVFRVFQKRIIGIKESI